MEAIVGPILSALIAAAPGLLAALTGKTSDTEAREHALATLATLRLIDVDGIIAAHRRPIAASPVHETDLLALDGLLRGATLSHEERGALTRVRDALRART